MQTRWKRYLVTLGIGVLAGLVLGYEQINKVNLASQNINIIDENVHLFSNSTALGLGNKIIQVPPADLLEPAWKVRQTWDVPSSTRILIAPHHLVAAKEIASLVSSLPFQPSTIFLISPDHFSQGKTPFTTTKTSFVSSQATTAVNTRAVNRLLEQISEALLQSNDHIFPREHGVHVLLPFINRTWPSASIVPLTIKDGVDNGDLEWVGRALSQELKQDPRAIILVSSDFSHYLPAEFADFHDERTIAALKQLDTSAVPHLETDVPGVLTVGLMVARELGLGNVTIHAHTNSLRLARATIDQQSTSHLLVSFSKGRTQETWPPRFVSALVFGQTAATKDHPIAHLAGPEGRVFRGQDAIVFPDDPSEGSPHGVNAAWINNPYSWYDLPPLGNIGRYQALTIVYSTSSKVNTCPEVIDIKEACGYIWDATRADVSMTFEPRMIPSLNLQPIESGGFRLIVRNPPSPTIQLAVGVTTNKNHDNQSTLRAYLYPMRASQNGSMFLTGMERQRMLEKIADQSPANLHSQILRGVVEWM